MKDREQSGSVRNDLIDILITLKNEQKNKKLEEHDLGF